MVFSLGSPSRKGVSWEKPSVGKNKVNGNKGKDPTEGGEGLKEIETFQSGRSIKEFHRILKEEDNHEYLCWKSIL